jgi:hypothetical protein
MKWDLNSGTLTVNLKVVALPYPAKEAILSNGVLVVRVDGLSGPNENNSNVLGVDSNGAIIWQISPRFSFDGYRSSAIALQDRGGELRVFFREGVYGVLDSRSGAYHIPTGQRPW